MKLPGVEWEAREQVSNGVQVRESLSRASGSTDPGRTALSLRNKCPVDSKGQSTDRLKSAR